MRTRGRHADEECISPLLMSHSLHDLIARQDDCEEKLRQETADPYSET